MLPISFLHFLVTMSYYIIGATAAKMVAISFPDSSISKAIAFITF